MAQKVSKTTTDHETIRRWVEERGGWPAEVAATARGDRTGIVRIDFPGFSGEGKLERISWDEWFDKFDRSSLAFVYEDETAGGERSRFNKLVSREPPQAREQGAPSTRRKAGGRRQAARAEAPSRAGARGTKGKARGGKKAGSRSGARSGSRSSSKSRSASKSRSRSR